MAAAGLAWFLGTLWAPAVFLVRGPLAHLLLSYPSGRLSSRVERAAVVAAYAYAVTYPVAADDHATIVFGVGLAALCARRYVLASGPERRARLAPLTAGIAFGAVLVVDAAARLAGFGGGRAPLVAYDLVVALLGLGLCVDVLSGRWSGAAVTGLVVDLGAPSSGARLRDRLARALGDPTLEVGYWLPEQRGYVDEAGRPLEVGTPPTGRAVLPIDADGERVAVLVHDASVVDDPSLRRAVAVATRLAFANARLQADVRTRLAAVAASRRRIVQASDEQRRRLERELRDGPERRLARMAGLLAEAGAPFAESRASLAAARTELREFARGMHPLTLDELAARSPVAVRVVGPPRSFPLPIEAAAYFVCSEALANVAKYAHASQVRIEVAERDTRVYVTVADDGIGGADASRGSGLRGLVDRIDALGGRLSVESPPGVGTNVSAEIPLAPDQG
jgi:signal transduction histidine kinase